MAKRPHEDHHSNDIDSEYVVHRAFLLASMFVGAAGFAVAFIANYPSGLISLGESNRTGTAHFVIGIIVMLLHILNPIVAAFRCKPSGKHRWVFNIFHASVIGVLAEAGALTNVGLGSHLLFNSNTPLYWVFVAFIVLVVTTYVFLVILFTVTSCLSKDPDRQKNAPSITQSCISSPESCEEKEVSMTQLGSEKKDEEEPKKKTPSKDSPIRWASLVIYLVLSTPLIIAMIGLAAGYKA